MCLFVSGISQAGEHDLTWHVVGIPHYTVKWLPIAIDYFSPSKIYMLEL